MKKISSVIWGVLLIGAGVIFALNAFEITDVNLFFDGWWTLFIIIPGVTGLFTEREKTGNIICILIGVFLLLCSQEVMSFSMLWKLLVPAVIVIVGLKLVFTGIFGNKANEIMANIKEKGGKPKSGCAVFSGCKMNYNNEVFDGAELTAVFGGVDLDLRNAVINEDCAIQATAVFGGVDILVSDRVNVKVTSNSVFGGVDNKTSARNGAPTLYVNAVAMFGGVEIK
ncbi:MAG: hypothetical protein E7580_03615 [Ruminococcaceae bacterium]|nr:hypothetical protein [Oscillospiraceae bacterium]